MTMPSTGSCSAGAYGDDVADAHVIDGDAGFLAVSHHAGGFRLRPANARMASPVPLRARASSSWPTSISVTTTPTASKYGSRAFSGRTFGAKVTTQESGECGQRAEADERVHLRRTVGDRGKTAAKIGNAA